MLGLAAAGIIVEERFGGSGYLSAVVERQNSRRRLPFAVRRLVVAHQQERLLRIAMSLASRACVGDDVGDVAVLLHLLAVADHRRIVVSALAGQDVPVVEAGRIA